MGGLTPYGYQLLTEEWPVEFYETTNPQLGKMMRDTGHMPATRKIGLMWRNDMKISNEGDFQRPVGFHTFKSDIHVFMADFNWSQDRLYEQLKRDGKVDTVPQAERDAHTKLRKVNASPPESTSYFGEEPYYLWDKWTSTKAFYHRIQIDHNGLKWDRGAWDIIVKAMREWLKNKRQGKNIFGQ